MEANPSMRHRPPSRTSAPARARKVWPYLVDQRQASTTSTRAAVSAPSETRGDRESGLIVAEHESALGHNSNMPWLLSRSLLGECGPNTALSSPLLAYSRPACDGEVPVELSC